MTTAKALKTLTTAEDAGLIVRVTGDELTVSGRLDPRPLGLLRDLRRDKAGILSLLRERDRARAYGRLGAAPTVVLPPGMCVVCFAPARPPDDMTSHPRLCESCHERIMRRARWLGGTQPDNGTNDDTATKGAAA